VFVFCDSRGAEEALALSLLPSGQLRSLSSQLPYDTGDDTDGDGVINLPGGSNVTCP
jgi:hypothetical protein